MLGLGEMYFIANAVRLGASPLALGLLVALPLAIGAFGPMVALSLLSRQSSRKRIAVVGAVGQGLTMVAIASLVATDLLTPETLIAAVCVHQVFGQSTGVAWSSWFGDVVPAATRGVYFAKRNRIVHLATLAATIGGGLTLHFLEPAAAAGGGGGRGYVYLLFGAAAARLISAILLSSTPEPAATPHERGFRGLGDQLAKGTPSRRIIILAFLCLFAVYLASPYFGPYMLEVLRLDYLEYMASAVAVILAKVFTLPAWGRVVDHYGARGPYLLALIFIAIIPIPWLWAGGIAWVLVAQVMSGAAWGGHELSVFSLLLERSAPANRPHVFAAVNIAQGIAQLAGTLIGALILELNQRHFVMLFAISIGARLLLAGLAPLVLPADLGKPVHGRRRVLLRLMGVRPSGGLAHRLIDADEDEDADENEDEPASGSNLRAESN